MTAVSADPRRLLDAAPLSRAQIIAIAIVGGLSALDGYDVLAVTFAAPGISHAWNTGKAALGLVLSSGLVGMALGSLLIAPFADVIGRRRMVLVNLALMASGMLLSAFATSIGTLALWRVVTGIGIGSMVPILAPMAVEFANLRYRTVSMAIMASGYPIGGMLGGGIATLLLQRFGWPTVFLLGTMLALAMVPVVQRWLPEPLAFLMARRNDDSLKRVNALLTRCDIAPVSQLPAPCESRKESAYRDIFRAGQRGATLQITAVNLLFMLTVYFLLSWMPQLTADAGFSPATATSISALCSLTGVVACILVSLFAPRARLRAIIAAIMVGFGIATAVFGYASSSLLLLASTAMLAGALLYSGITGLYALIVETFHPAMRATGVGFVMGIGRASAAIGPAIAGALFAAGASPRQVSIVIGMATVLAGLLLIRRPRALVSLPPTVPAAE